MQTISPDQLLSTGKSGIFELTYITRRIFTADGLCVAVGYSAIVKDTHSSSKQFAVGLTPLQAVQRALEKHYK